MNNNITTQELAVISAIEVLEDARKERVIRENLARWNATEWNRVKQQTRFNATFNSIGQYWPSNTTK